MNGDWKRMLEELERRAAEQNQTMARVRERFERVCGEQVQVPADLLTEMQDKARRIDQSETSVATPFWALLRA